ncbi:MAG: hypothetical protein NT157_05140, partial [Candidatus Micrarchaeota archaeon]|nr:hypothetical protein [Candidatus Micrarchaeota archaeon]
PVGMVLGAFPFSRGAGGTLMALAVGLYLIFPLTYLVNEEITYEYCSTHNGCNVELGAVISGSARDIANDMLKEGGNKSVRLMQLLSYDGPLGPVIYLSTFSAGIMPIFSLLVTLTLVKGLARIFGADVDFSTLIKVI